MELFIRILHAKKPRANLSSFPSHSAISTLHFLAYHQLNKKTSFWVSEFWVSWIKWECIYSYIFPCESRRWVNKGKSRNSSLCSEISFKIYWQHRKREMGNGQDACSPCAGGWVSVCVTFLSSYLRAINPVTSSTCRRGKRRPRSCISCIYHNYFPRNLPPKKSERRNKKKDRKWWWWTLMNARGLSEILQLWLMF